MIAEPGRRASSAAAPAKTNTKERRSYGEDARRVVSLPTPARALRFDGRVRGTGRGGRAVLDRRGARRGRVDLGTAAPGSAGERPQGAPSPGAGERCGTLQGGTRRRDRRLPDEADRRITRGAFGELGALKRGVWAASFGGPPHCRGRSRDGSAVSAAAVGLEAPPGERGSAGHRGAYPESRARARGARRGFGSAGLVRGGARGA